MKEVKIYVIICCFKNTFCWKPVQSKTSVETHLAYFSLRTQHFFPNLCCEYFERHFLYTISQSFALNFAQSISLKANNFTLILNNTSVIANKHPKFRLVFVEKIGLKFPITSLKKMLYKFLIKPIWIFGMWIWVNASISNVKIFIYRILKDLENDYRH